MDSLTKDLSSLELTTTGNCVPFDPTGENANGIIANRAATPRYLFHVYDSKTKSTTDGEWVKSLDAINKEKDHMEDIFKRLNASDVALGLNEHLRWSSPTTSGKNNLVSWSNSLPFAIAYAIYRNKFPGLRTPLSQIYLCVVDTSKLPPGVFIKDMDLMQAYRDALPYDKNIKIFIRGQRKCEPWSQYGLPNLITFREKRDREFRHRTLDSYNYFGEYLSQGRLKIEGACTIIQFDDIINSSLYKLYPRFGHLMDGSQAEWAKTVMELRESFYTEEPPKPITEVEVRAVNAITRNLDSKWRLVIAANLFTLRPLRDDDQELLSAFRDRLNGTHRSRSSQIPQLTHKS